MALISTVPITDNFGNIYENAYGVIDQCNGNKKDKQQLFVFEIYRSLLDRQNNIQPFKQDTILVSGEEFDSWFSLQAIIANGGNQYLAAYNYLLQLRVDEILKYPDWRIADISEDVLIDYIPITTPDWNGLSNRVLGGDLFPLFVRLTLAGYQSTAISQARGDINVCVAHTKIEAALASGFQQIQANGFVFTDEEKLLWNNAVIELGFSEVVKIV